MTINVECDAGGRHEWDFYETVYNDRGGSALVAVAECRNCPLEIGPEQMKRLLNAAMQLTADEAEVRASKFEIGGIFSVDKRLRGYARTWRGDTEESHV